MVDALITMLDGWILVGFIFGFAVLFVRALEALEKKDNA